MRHVNAYLSDSRFHDKDSLMAGAAAAAVVSDSSQSLTNAWLAPWSAVFITCSSILCLCVMLIMCACIQHHQKTKDNETRGSRKENGTMKASLSNGYAITRVKQQQQQDYVLKPVNGLCRALPPGDDNDSHSRSSGRSSRELPPVPFVEQNNDATSITAPLFVCTCAHDVHASICTLESDLNSDADPLYTSIQRKQVTSAGPSVGLGSPHSSAQSTPSRNHCSRIRIWPTESSGGGAGGHAGQHRLLQSSGVSDVYSKVCRSSKCNQRRDQRQQQQHALTSTDDECDAERITTRDSVSLSDSFLSCPPLPAREYGQSEIDLLQRLRNEQALPNQRRKLGKSDEHKLQLSFDTNSDILSALQEQSSFRRVGQQQTSCSVASHITLNPNEKEQQSFGEDVYERIDDVDSGLSNSRGYAVDSYSDLYNDFLVDDWAVRCPLDSLSTLSFGSENVHFQFPSTIGNYRVDPLRRASYHSAITDDQIDDEIGLGPCHVAKSVPRLLSEMHSFRFMDSDLDICQHMTPRLPRLNQSVSVNDTGRGSLLNQENNEHDVPASLLHFNMARHSVMTPLMERSIEGSLFDIDNLHQRCYTTQTSYTTSSSVANSPMDGNANTESLSSLDGYLMVCSPTSNLMHPNECSIGTFCQQHLKNCAIYASNGTESNCVIPSFLLHGKNYRFSELCAT